MMQSGLTIAIKIQSISDLITNSSSEVFCTITGNDLDAIWKVLNPLFPGFDEECCPVIDLFEAGEWDEDNPAMIQIRFPNYIDGISDFYHMGLEHILDQNIGRDNYTIKYEY